MSLFLELSSQVDDQYQKCVKGNRRIFVSKKKKKAVFIEKSGRLLEDMFYEICKRTEISQFVECGAYDAYASRKIKDMIPNVNAVAYEANPHVFRNFYKMLESANVKYLNKALSNNIGAQELILKTKDTKSWSSEGFLKLEENFDSNLESINVVTTTLDVELLETLEQVPTGTWIDVEGSNKVLIEGADKFLSSKLVEVLLIESQVDIVWKSEFTAPELCEILMAYGFTPIARDCPQHWGCNILFVKNDLVPELYKLKLEFLNQLESIRIPYFPNIEYRTLLGKYKNFIIKIFPTSQQESLHKFFGFLGSRSSRDKI